MLDTCKVCFTYAFVNTPNALESVRPFSGKYSVKADLKLNAWFGVSALFAIVSQKLLSQHLDSNFPLRAAVALSPLIPFALYVRSCIRFIRGMDELQRRIQVEAWLTACLATLMIGTCINVLNANGVPLSLFGLRLFPHGLAFPSAFLVTFVIWIISHGVANRRYE